MKKKDKDDGGWNVEYGCDVVALGIRRCEPRRSCGWCPRRDSHARGLGVVGRVGRRARDVKSVIVSVYVSSACVSSVASVSMVGGESRGDSGCGRRVGIRRRMSPSEKRSFEEALGTPYCGESTSRRPRMPLCHGDVVYATRC